MPRIDVRKRRESPFSHMGPNLEDLWSCLNDRQVTAQREFMAVLINSSKLKIKVNCTTLLKKGTPLVAVVHVPLVHH
jgi:hypothetical protein